MSNIDRATCKKVRIAMDKAIAEALEPFGLTASIGNMKYTGSTITVQKFTATSTSSKTLAKSEKDEFERDAKFYGFTASDYGRKFESRGKFYTLIGFNPSRPKNCISIRREDGKKMMCSESTAKNMMRNG